MRIYLEDAVYVTGPRDGPAFADLTLKARVCGLEVERTLYNRVGDYTQVTLSQTNDVTSEWEPAIPAFRSALDTIVRNSASQVTLERPAPRG